MIESYGKDVKTELGANFYDTVQKVTIGVEIIVSSESHARRYRRLPI